MIDWEKNVLAPNQRVFGESMTYYPVVGSPFVFSGIFDNAFKHIELTEYAPNINTTFPVVGINLAEFSRPPVQSDRLTITSTGLTYIVREARNDSHGGCLLILNQL